MHIKTTVSYHFVPTRLAVSRQTTISAGKDVEKLEPSDAGGMDAGSVDTLKNRLSS